jgi:hypothetical protein
MVAIYAVHRGLIAFFKSKAGTTSGEKKESFMWLLLTQSSKQNLHSQ